MYKLIRKMMLALTLISAAYCIPPARAAAPAAQTPALPALRLKVACENDSLAVWHNGQRAVLNTEAANGLFARYGTFELIGNRLSIKAINTIIIEAEEIGYSAELNNGAQAKIRSDCKKGTSEISSVGRDAPDIIVTFSDGGKASIPPGSTITYEGFPDKTYFVSAINKVSSENADGQKMDISENTPPLMGGPLDEVKDENGQIRHERRTPRQDVKISGKIGGEITVQIGDETKTVYGVVPQVFSLKNGSQIEFKNSSDQQGFEWKVEKGVFRISVTGIDNWRAMGATGSQGKMQWNEEIKVVDLQNISAEGNILALLPQRTSAGLPPKATLQFSHMDALTFGTSATGGRVKFVNSGTKEEFDLTSRNIVFKGGRPLMNSVGGAQQINPLLMSWDKGAPLELTGLVGKSTVPPNTKKVFAYSKGNEVGLNYEEGGEVTIEALSGDFSLRLSALNGMTIEIVQGDKVSFSLDLKKGTFVVRAADENSTPVRIVTSDGFNPVLAPSNALNFNMGKDGSLSATSSGKQVFFRESAGFDRLSQRLLTSSQDQSNVEQDNSRTLSELSNNFDSDGRIRQPPLSTVR